MDEFVTITIGIGSASSGVFKPVRGKSLPLKVNKRASAQTVLGEALKKRRSYDRTFRNDKSYKLCFPDGSEVTTLPGTKEAFTLEKYKEDLGKSYARISLFLCPLKEASDSESEQTCWPWLDLEFESDEWLDDVDIADRFAVEISEHSSATTSTTTVCAAASRSLTSTNSNGAVACSFSGSTPVNASQSTAAITTVALTPDVTLNANQDAGQAATSDTNEVFTSVDVSECASSSECPLSGGAIQLNDENVGSRPPLDYDHGTAPIAVKDVLVHRFQVLKDLIEEFKALDIPTHHYHLNLVIVNERGEIEDGRGLGVVREVITLFWHQFFRSLSIGATEKVPSVRHDYQLEEWEAVGKVLVYGYCEIMYFPVTLSGVFMGSCLFEESTISDSFLLEAFLSYIGKDEAETLRKCTEGELDANDDEVLEVLSSYKCYKNPTKENVKLIITQLAHQELVQKPKYISNCWKPIISSLKSFSQFKTLDCMKKVYETKKPTARKVVKLLSASPQNEAERTSFDHLKRYIKSLGEVALKAFLQFTTGSDVIAVTEITVAFNSLDGAHRSPIARTCGPVLEVPTTYQSYNELSEEFENLISNKEAWGFTMV